MDDETDGEWYWVCGSPYLIEVGKFVGPRTLSKALDEITDHLKQYSFSRSCEIYLQNLKEEKGMFVGKTMWHVGKNVATQEVKVKWVSPEEGPEALILVEKVNPPSYAKYALIPRRQLTEIRPIKRCDAYFALSLTNGTRCDLPDNHLRMALRHHAHLGSGNAEIYWS